MAGVDTGCSCFFFVFVSSRIVVAEYILLNVGLIFFLIIVFSSMCFVIYGWVFVRRGPATHKINRQNFDSAILRNPTHPQCGIN